MGHCPSFGMVSRSWWCVPLMEKVVGRVADFLVKKDGTRVAGVSLIENTLTRIPGILQMQIIQESLGVIVLKVVPGPDFGLQRKAELVYYFERIFQPSTRIDLELVQAI